MAAVALISKAEGCRLKAYKCPAGVWTIGWGRTERVRRGDTCTQERADDWLCDDLRLRADAVRSVCTVAPTDNELGAMVSLAYNIGAASFRRSSVLRAHNRIDPVAAARAFSLWNKARVDGKLVALRGLTARRLAEAALYIEPS